MTIKLKITLWFTGFMILLSGSILVFIALVSGSASQQQQRASLTGLVDRNMQQVEYDDDRLELDDDFKTFQNGIYCLVFYENGSKFSGYSPYDELEREPFADGELRPVAAGGETYLIYDRLVSFSRYEDIWIRGIASEEHNLIAPSAVYQAAMIALPLLVILASAGGYLIAGSSLRPMKEISKTAEEIGSSGDLSMRISMAGNGDELNQLAGTFNRMFERLETNFEAERHFTSDASHELRTPVATILAQCEYAFENASGEQELYEAIGAIQKQGYRMSHLIESLLSLTRIEQQTEKPEFKMIDLSRLVQVVCQEQKERDEKGITLTAEIMPGINMKADADLVAGMLENLIRNAYRYGREDGRILVRLEQVKEGIVLSVSDNGIGMAGEELEKIWNRFYRIDQSRSSSRGFGLGLAMVRQIAGLHGGRIRVASEPGKGSIFTVTFGF